MTDTVSILEQLIARNSVNPEWGGPGELELSRFVAGFFRKSRLEIVFHPVIGERENIYVTLPGRDRSRCIVMEAHMDTVSVDGMEIPPFKPEIRDGKVFGRGACDVKGGLAAMMSTIGSLARRQEMPACDVILAAVVDEEHAYRGVLHLIDWLKGLGVSLEAAIVAEPTELRAVCANKGVLRFEIETVGKSAHSSKPHLGRNAITDMAGVILDLEEYHKELSQKSHPLVGPATGNVGLIEGGAQVNFVPDRCVITVDRRLLPDETGDTAMDEYEAVLETARQKNPGMKVTLSKPLLSDEGMETPDDSPVVQTASRVLEQLGLDPTPAGVPFGCDVTKLSRVGIPGIIFGPGSIDQAHGNTEWVDIDQLEKAVDFYRGFLLEWEDAKPQS